jgi:hypothetical protein
MQSYYSDTNKFDSNPEKNSMAAFFIKVLGVIRENRDIIDNQLSQTL